MGCEAFEFNLNLCSCSYTEYCIYTWRIPMLSCNFISFLTKIEKIAIVCAFSRTTTMRTKKKILAWRMQNTHPRSNKSNLRIFVVEEYDWKYRQRILQITHVQEKKHQKKLKLCSCINFTVFMVFTTSIYRKWALNYMNLKWIAKSTA